MGFGFHFGEANLDLIPFFGVWLSFWGIKSWFNFHFVGKRSHFIHVIWLPLIANVLRHGSFGFKWWLHTSLHVCIMYEELNDIWYGVSKGLPRLAADRPTDPDVSLELTEGEQGHIRIPWSNWPKVSKDISWCLIGADWRWARTHWQILMPHWSWLKVSKDIHPHVALELTKGDNLFSHAFPLP